MGVGSWSLWRKVDDGKHGDPAASSSSLPSSQVADF